MINIKVKNYDPMKVSVVVGGVLVDGYSDGTHITVTQNEDLTTQSVGNDGEVTYNENPNQTGTMSLELMNNSDSVRELIESSKRRELITISILDNNVDSQSVRLIGCRAKNIPEYSRGKEISPITIEYWYARQERV